MALAETAELAVKLTLGGNFLRQMGQVNRSLKGFDKNASRAYRAGEQIGTGIKRGAYIAVGAVGLLATQVALGLDSLIKLEEATAQTEAVIKSTGNTAGVTAQQVRDLAEKYEGLNAVISDEVIQSGENLLLTFTAVTKEAFEPALQAALDLSTAMGTDLNSAVKTVGKALSDPAKAAGKLARAGIVLTKEEQKQIDAHLANNDALGAQDVILQALNKRYGGSFLAQGGTTKGKVAKFTDSIEDLQRALAKALLPAIGNIADALTELLQDPETIRAIEDIGKSIAEMFSPDNIKKGVGILKDAVGTIRSIAGPIADIVRGAVSAFTSLPPDIQKLLVGGFAVNKLTGGLITNIAGGIFGALKAMTVQAAVVNVTGGVVNGGGGPAGGAAKGITAAAVAGLAASAAVIVGSLFATQELINKPKQQRAADVGSKNAQAAIASGDAKRIQAALDGIKAATAHLTPIQQVLYDLNANGIKTHTEKLEAALRAALREVQMNQTHTGKETDDKVNSVKQATDAVKRATEARLAAVKAAQLETKRETTRGAAMTTTATRGVAPPIVSAIYANRPIVTTIVNVSATTVTKEYTVNKRYGNSGGSRNGNGHAGNSGPLP